MIKSDNGVNFPVVESTAVVGLNWSFLELVTYRDSAAIEHVTFRAARLATVAKFAPCTAITIGAFLLGRVEQRRLSDKSFYNLFESGSSQA